MTAPASSSEARERAQTPCAASSSEARERAQTRTEALFGALLFVGALAPRLYVALAWANEPVWDGHYYDFGARRIADGLGYSDDRSVGSVLVWHPWCHYPVGYSAFLAPFYRLFGASYAVAGVANALVGAALAVVTWALARHALSSARARVAGWVVALHPGLILYAALVMSEPLAALLTLLSFWLAVRDRRPWRALAAAAPVLGLAALVRPQALLCAPFLALAAVAHSPNHASRAGWLRPIRVRAPFALAACALSLLPVLPWTVRNCRVMDGCALISTNGGWNLAIGAFPRATGRFETLRSSDGCRDVIGQVDQDRCWLRYGLSQIRARPLRWLSLIPAKLGFTFDHESFAAEYLHEARPDAWPEERRRLVRGVTTFAHRLLLSGAALGCIAFPHPRLRVRKAEQREGEDRRNNATRTAAAIQGGLLVVAAGLGALALSAPSPAFWPMAVFSAVLPWVPFAGHPAVRPALLMATALLATTLVTHAVFFGEDRYHVVVTPVLALLAAGALRPGSA